VLCSTLTGRLFPSDLVWSDPLEDDTALDLDDDDIKEWRAVDFVENPTRGCGQVFGYAYVVVVVVVHLCILCA
jgi:hypothetical protein